MTVTCAINCSVNGSQQLELDSSHTSLVEPRPNEFDFELDIDNNQSVSFEIADFVYGGNNYTVSVTAVRNDSTTQTWTHDQGACSSPVETEEAELDIDVTATPSSGSPLSGGGIIRIRPKGKPD